MNYEVLIQNGSTVYQPSIVGTVQVTSERLLTPSKLTLDVYADENLKVEEGNKVQLKVDGVPVFLGFIFTMKYDKDKISITAYDQLRYLKNKDTKSYSNKRADELIDMLATEYNLTCGKLSNTGYKIASRVEDNTSLLDMIQNAIDLTTQATGNLYIMYDDFGKITLSGLEDLIVPILIDEETASSVSYKSSIDSSTYNKIKLIYEDSKTKAREVYIAQDSASMGEWGTLQYFEKIKNNVNGKAMADALLKLYNKKSRSLSISGAFGDTRVRGGSLIAVQLNLGDVKLQNLMLVDKCTHKFSNDEHLMDLTLSGRGEFYA